MVNEVFCWFNIDGLCAVLRERHGGIVGTIFLAKQWVSKNTNLFNTRETSHQSYNKKITKIQIIKNTNIHALKLTF